MTQTLETRPRDATPRSTRSKAAARGLSQTAISRIWRAFSLQPHRTETQRHRAIEFRKLLDTIEDAVPAGLDVHLVVDNYGTHKTPLIKRWLARHPRYHLHFTPTGASRINLVERWFATLTERQIRRGSHRSTREPTRAIKSYST